jgi:hypothetical protein
MSATGTAPRLVYRTPDWEDFVDLAATESATSGQQHQVARRLRAAQRT